jgi:hypothetical protein
MSLPSNNGSDYSFSATMPDGKLFKSFSIIVAPVPGYNYDYIWLDNISVTGVVTAPVQSQMGVMVEPAALADASDSLVSATAQTEVLHQVAPQSHVAIVDAQDSSELQGERAVLPSAHASTATVQGLVNSDHVIDLSGLVVDHGSVEKSGSHEASHQPLQLSLADVLEHGSKNLFVADEHVQLMVKGHSGDDVVLEKQVHDAKESGDWVAAGKVSVGGEIYQAYQHSSLPAELLIQDVVQVHV